MSEWVGQKAALNQQRPMGALSLAPALLCLLLPWAAVASYNDSTLRLRDTPLGLTQISTSFVFRRQLWLRQFLGETPQQRLDDMRSQMQQQQQQQEEATMHEEEESVRATRETATGVSTGEREGRSSRYALNGCQLSMMGGRPERQGQEQYGGWYLCENGVFPGAVVYSFGLGSDVSFDWALLQRGCKVYGWDPTKTHKYIRLTFQHTFETHKMPKRFYFTQVGLGEENSLVEFYRQKGAPRSSMSAIMLSNYKGTGFHAKLQTLTTCRKQWGHTWIDILKLDVEGVEFGVCETKEFRRNLRQVTQVLIEFHDRMMAGGKQRKRKCVKALTKMGFTVVHQTLNAREISFARLKT